MLYIGNFSYSDVFDDNDNYCLMPAIVEAPDTDTALERFSEMLQKLHDETLITDGAQDIFLDSLVEVSENPEEALLIQWQKIVQNEDGLYSVLSALPTNDEIAEAYSWGKEDVIKEPEEDDYDDEEEDNKELDQKELEETLASAFSMLLCEEDLGPAEEPFISFDA